MDWQLLSHYFLGILTLPVSVWTVKSVIENVGTLFDEDLSIKDRNLLKQFAFFVLLPMVVLFHELGHALVARYFGATISAFHWSMFWGEVVIDGRLTPFQHYVVALAGNLFQLSTCLFALLLALLETSPALVALSIYFYLFNGLACLIGYPLLSLTSWNDDFAMIYGTPDKGLAALTAVIHIALIAIFLWSYFGSTGKLWFVKKTRPTWYKEFAKVLARAEQEDDGINYLSVAWQYYFVGLDALCQKALDKAQSLDATLMDVWLLRGYINQSKGRYESAILCFKEITDSASSDKVLLARAWMACGHCQTQKIENSRVVKPDWHEVLKSYKQAEICDNSLADPHYYLGVTLIKAELLKDAEAELQLCQNTQRAGKEPLSWLDPMLGSMVQQEINTIRNLVRAKQ